MSEFDNLEALSNADLRAICIKHGLPNVPVTDTSRKLLIKKLRAINEPQSSKKASANRRDTIAAVEKVTPSAISKSADDDAAKRKANRRTIAATSTSQAVPPPKVVEPAPNKVFEVKIKEKVAAAPAPIPAPAPAPAPAPITSRRRSVQREPAPAPPKPVVMQTIVLDDDEEEEVDSLLAIAADTAERQNYVAQRESPYKRADRSRSSSLSKTEVVTTSHSSNVRVMTPVLEQAAFSEPFEPTARSSSIYQSSASSTSHERYTSTTAGRTYSGVPIKPTPLAGSFGEAPLTSRQIQSSSSYSKEPYASRYSSVLGAAKDYASPSLRYSVPASSRPLAAAASPALASQFQEFSDYESGDQAEDTFKTPFLSKFARDLEHLKTQPLSPGVGSASSVPQRRAQRHTVYETPGHRRPINTKLQQPDDSVSAAFWELWADLDRRYNVKTIFKFIIILVIVIFVYVMVTP